jgi:hypothetical protein
MYCACNRFLRFGRSIVRKEAPAVAAADPDTEELLALPSQGEDRAREQLLDRHRDRLRHMVACRLDRRLAARIDPSDVVREALAEAAAMLSDFLRERQVPFYPCVRRLAEEKRYFFWELARASQTKRHIAREFWLLGVVGEPIIHPPRCLSVVAREVKAASGQPTVPSTKDGAKRWVATAIRLSFAAAGPRIRSWPRSLVSS